MDTRSVHKAQLDTDTAEALRQYLIGRRQFALDRSEHHRYIYIELPLINRSEVQDILDRSPSLFSASDLSDLKKADKDVLDNLDTAAEWVRNLVGEPDQPRSHWWWYLDLIADEMMPAPDLDEIYSSLIKKAERRTVRAF